MTPFVRFCVLALFSTLLCAPVCLADTPASSSQPVAAIFADPSLPGYHESLIVSLESTLRAEGYIAKRVSTAEIAGGEITRTNTTVLVLPDARHLPTALGQPVNVYLRAGGNLLTLGAPAWSEAPVRGKDGSWITDAQIQRLRLRQPLHGVILDTADASKASTWRRSTDTPDRKTTFEIVPAPQNLKVLGVADVAISNLDSWDTICSPSDAKASLFPQGDTLTAFWAKGDINTTQIAIEWDERDGSRWIAIQPIGTEWKRYVLEPQRFHSWQNSPERAAKGFQPENATRIGFGVARSHTESSPGPHEYWFAGVGTMPDVIAPAEQATPPILDTLFPSYKVYPIHGSVSLRAVAGQTGSDQPSLSAPAEIYASQPRPSGTGLFKERFSRWQPVVTAVDAKTGEWRGSPVVMVVHNATDPSFPNSVWETFSIQDPAFYETAGARSLIASFARRLRTGLFLNEGGTDAFTYFEGDEVTLGGACERVSASSSSDASLQLTVTAPDGKVAYEHRWKVTIASTGVAQFSDKWKPSTWPEEGYTVTTTLYDGDKPVDRLEHKIHVWKPSAKPSFITIGEDGHFHLNGKVWRVCGVNYMPSSGIGLNDHEQFEYWIEKKAYDPEIVERDLRHIARLGFNEISIFINVRSIPSRNLLDILRMSRDLGLRVNLALRPGMPSQFVASDLLGILSAYRLQQNDTVFAYDIAWEPIFGGRARRIPLDPEWRNWVNHKYGSVDAAGKAWNFTPALDSAGLIGPSDAQLSSMSGAFDHMVADYRRFLSDWLATRYGEAAKALHDADPRHAVSFRMSDAGSPINDQKWLPYEIAGVAKAVDFLSPEGYALPTGDEGVKAASFEVAYARSAAPSKPVVWAEVGKQVWDRTDAIPSPALMRTQTSFYADLFKSLRLSDGDGIIFWWYPGGYRVNENSDFGLVNPDGTDREAALVIQREAQDFLNRAPLPAPTVWLDFDRFAHPNGIRGTYLDLGDKFWAAESSGQRVFLRMTGKD
ncbi:MAG: beta-galactosidase [Capsulimonadaceae bacterium]|nr:beta-galactosidase [Capsulimonadaceae bacterium]